MFDRSNLKSKISTDSLQNEIILIKHHVGDAMKALGTKDLGYIKKSLMDIDEAANRLSKFVTKPERNEINRATKED